MRKPEEYPINYLGLIMRVRLYCTPENPIRPCSNLQLVLTYSDLYRNLARARSLKGALKGTIGFYNRVPFKGI